MHTAAYEKAVKALVMATPRTATKAFSINCLEGEMRKPF